MLQYSLGKNKTSKMPSSGAGEIHKSSAQKQEKSINLVLRSRREEMMHTALELKVQEKQKKTKKTQQL